MVSSAPGTGLLPRDWRSWDVNAPSRVDYSGLQTAGSFMQFGGALVGAIGGYFAAEAQRSEIKSQALSAEFESSMSALNARAAEKDVFRIQEAGRQELMFADLRASADKATQKVSAAARGVAVGTGSSAEIAASIELARQIEARTIRTNTARAAGARLVEATNERNRGTLAGISSRNLRASAHSINPFLGATGGLLGSVGAVASSWAVNRQNSYATKR